MFSTSYFPRITSKTGNVHRNIEARSSNHSCSGKAIGIPCCGCVFVTLSYPVRNAHQSYCHLWAAPFYNVFTHYLINDTIVLKNRYWTQKVCFGFPSTLVWNISNPRKNWAICYHKCVLVFMCSAVIVIFERNLSFLDRFSTNTQILNFLKIRPVEAELFYADGQTDGNDEANSRSSQ
jgi:hypothetical protein